VDGNAAAYRLLTLLAMNVVVLKVESLEDFELWFYPMLKPWEHYVPVNKDLTDLEEKIEWCKEHDDECKQIAENAKKLVVEKLGREHMLNYLQRLTQELNQKIEPTVGSLIDFKEDIIGVERPIHRDDDKVVHDERVKALERAIERVGDIEEQTRRIDLAKEEGREER